MQRNSREPITSSLCLFVISLEGQKQGCHLFLPSFIEAGYFIGVVYCVSCSHVEKSFLWGQETY